MKSQMLRFKSAIIRENEMWCVPRVMNWLFKISLDDWTIKSICDLGLDDELHIEYVYQYQNSIWCIASKGENIVSYNVITGEIEHFVMESNDQNKRGAVLFNEKLWIIPIKLPGEMVLFDIKKKEFMVYDQWKKECVRKKIKGKNVSFCHAENKIYLAMKDECKIVYFDLRKGIMEVKTLPEKTGLHCILKIGDEIFATSYEKRDIYRWNEKSGTEEKFCCSYKKDKKYIRGLEFRDKVLLIDDETIDVFDINTEKIYPLENLPKGLKNDYQTISANPLFFQSLKNDSRFFLLPWNGNMMLEFNERNNSWEGRILEIPKEFFLDEFVVKKLKKYNLISEDEIMLDDFFEYIETAQSLTNRDEIKKEIGYKIFHQLIMN